MRNLFTLTLLIAGSALLVWPSDRFWKGVVIAVATAVLATLSSWYCLGAFCQGIWDLPRVVFDAHRWAATAVLGYVERGLRPQFRQWTLAFEVVRAIMHGLLSRYGANLVMERNARTNRALADRVGTALGWLSCRYHHTMLIPKTFNGLEHLWLRAREPVQSQKPHDPLRIVILYYHGGGYVLLSPRFYIDFGNRLRAATLAALGGEPSVQVDVLLANYRKSPEFASPIPQRDAMVAYQHLVQQERLQPNQIILAGDSAGGNLVLATLLRLRDQQQVMPLAGILSCPLTNMDLAQSDPVRDDRRCVLGKEFLRAASRALLPTIDDRETWGYVSAVHCNLRGLPHMFTQVGTSDCLYQDALQLYAKAEQDGATPWELDTFEHMPHIFTMMPAFVLPDSTRGVARLGAFAAKRIRASQIAQEKI